MNKAKSEHLYDLDNLPTTTLGQVTLLRDLLLDTEYTYRKDSRYVEREYVYEEILRDLEKKPAIY